MKKPFIILSVSLFLTILSYSQSKTYWSAGGEMIFSFAAVDYNGEDEGSIMRWAPVINFQGMYNYDAGKSFGLFTGLAIRNVGYIYDDYVDRDNIEVKKKFRTYNLGIPAGIKIGNLKKVFLYAGYEVEFPFHYKEKTFKDENKDKLTVWFSDRVQQFQHGVLAGIQFPYGFNVKFKYYFSEFHEQGYTESDGYQPYKGLQSNVFYFSLNFNLFTPIKTYYDKDSRNEYY